MWDYFSLDWEKYPQYGFNTRAIHAGNDPLEQRFGGVAPAIDLSTTYA
jgi:cystathionine beta-lyase/cystathionine gamma-synthase